MRSSKSVLTAKEKKARKYIKAHSPIEKILYSADYGDYVQIVGKAGGDVLTYRYYSDGDVYEE